MGYRKGRGLDPGRTGTAGVTARRMIALSGAALLASAFVLPPLAAQDNPLTQRGVPAEAAAEDAVAARERAHANARRIAFQRLAEALGTTAPAWPDSQIEPLVAAMVIEEERTTATRYIGRLTVRFAPAAAAALGRPLPGAPEVPSPRLEGPSATVATVVAVAQLGSLEEWLELRRRLRASGGVSEVEIREISIDQARLRLGLRAPPAEAAALLTGAGLVVAQEGAAWQVALAGRR